MLKRFFKNPDGTFRSSHGDDKYPNGYKLGVTYSVSGKVKPCSNGYHATNIGYLDDFSARAYGESLCLVKLFGYKVKRPEKTAARSMVIVKELDIKTAKRFTKFAKADWPTLYRLA